MKTKVMQRPRKNSSEIEVLSRNVGVRGRRDRIFDGMIYVSCCIFHPFSDAICDFRIADTLYRGYA